MSHVIRKKNMLQVAGILCVEIAESNNRTFFERSRHEQGSGCFLYMNCLSSFLQKGVPCHSLGGSSWISQQLLKVMLRLAQIMDRPKISLLHIQYSCLTRGVSKKTRGSLKACTTSAFSAAWHQQAQSQIRFYKRFGSLMYMACKLMDNIFWKWYGSSFAS